jgi:hypothetical protein
VASRKAKRVAIAEEKRKWAVRWYTRDGKPDKNRRPGRPFEKAAYAGAEKQTYSGGVGVNLLAHIQGDKKKNEVMKQKRDYVKKSKKGKAVVLSSSTGPSEDVDQALNSTSLQVFLDEVNMYQQLLEPIAKIMRDNMGAPPGKPNPQQLGWGPVGALLPEAMHGVAAVPSHWQRQRDEDMMSSDLHDGVVQQQVVLRSGNGNLTSRSNLSSTTDDDESNFVSLLGSTGSNGFMHAIKPRSSAESQQPVDMLNLPPVKPPSGFMKNDKKNRSNSRYRSALLHSESLNELGNEEAYKVSEVVPVGVGVKNSKAAAAASVVMNAKRAAKEAELAALMRERELERIVQDSERKSKEIKELKDSMAAKRKSRKEQSRRSGVIPWELLDALDGEKHKFQNEVSYVEVYKKF